MMFRGVGLALGVLLFAGLHCRAEVPCGIGAVTEVVAPVYPPLARAAHVSGIVVLLANFDTQGRAIDVHAVSGPVMLRIPAETFVKGWAANPYTGLRSCPMVVEYVLDEAVCGAEENGIPVTPYLRSDSQHVLVKGCLVVLSDPSAVPGRKRRFGLF